MEKDDIILISRNTYFICLGFTVILGIFLIGCRVFDIPIASILPKEDRLHALTGLYCPGCGGTRAVRALLNGKILKSFYYHPCVLYVVLFDFCFLISHTISILSKSKIPPMRVYAGYFYMLIEIILVQWIVKNYFVIVYHVQILI